MMRKLLLISLTVLLTSLASLADVTINSTNFPDANFRSYLLSEYPSGVITTAQLNSRTEMSLFNKGISNLRGIEYFTELTRLDCSMNNLTEASLNANSKLTYLNLAFNKLSWLDLFQNNLPDLEELYLQENQLNGVYVVGHSKLRTLWLSRNTSMRSVECYEDALTDFSLYGCTALKNLYCSSNPDLATINGLSDCTALTTLRCYNCSLTSLDATVFPELTLLQCFSNQLRSLDVTHCPALEELNCGNNLLTRLDVSHCPALTSLACHKNILTSLDVSACQGLETLVCSDNLLTSIDVSGFTALSYLWCSDNYLTSLDLSCCPALEKALFYHNRIDYNEMDNLIESVITRDELASDFFLAAVDPTGGEENILTASQVLKLMKKGWYTGKLIEEEDMIYSYYLYQALMWDDTISAGTTFTLPVVCYESYITSLQFDVYLPDGFTFVKAEKGILCNQNATLTYQSSDHYNNGRRYRRVSLTNANLAVAQSDFDAVIDLTIQAPSGSGQYLFSIENVKVTGDESIPKDWYNGYTMLTVEGGGLRGDVDDSGSVNIADVTALIKYLLSHNATGVNLTTADCDKNGSVNISDVTTLIHYLLSHNWPSGSAKAPARALPAHDMMAPMKVAMRQ